MKICLPLRLFYNQGACLRVGAAVGATKIILTNGCVSPWNRKVLRGGAGAHFKVHVLFIGIFYEIDFYLYMKLNI